MPEQMKGHCNSYGFLGALCAVSIVQFDFIRILYSLNTNRTLTDRNRSLLVSGAIQKLQLRGTAILSLCWMHCRHRSLCLCCLCDRNLPQQHHSRSALCGECINCISCMFVSCRKLTSCDCDPGCYCSRTVGRFDGLLSVPGL